MRILIVENQEEGRYLLERLLTGSGFEVLSAANGREALEKAHCEPPDLVISDILMPVMDGFALCRRWKADETLAAIPFVFYTATYTEEADEELALDLGAERFIRKADEPEAFVGKIREVIDEHEKNPLVAPREPVEDEEEFYKTYNEVLVRQLERKLVQLEEANRALAEAEAALRRLNRGLEAQVEERTAELQTMVDAMAGREIRMAELKEAVRALRAQLEEAGIEPAADDPLLGEGE